MEDFEKEYLISIYNSLKINDQKLIINYPNSIATEIYEILLIASYFDSSGNFPKKNPITFQTISKNFSRILFKLRIGFPFSSPCQEQILSHVQKYLRISPICHKVG